MSSTKVPPSHREEYVRFLPVQTRWMDNDAYGHVNNVVYYAYFDTVVNRYLIEEGGLDIQRSPIIGIIVESGCRYHTSIAYPDALEAGLRVGHLGRSSVRYELALFRAGQSVAVADGYFIHVFVDRATMRPVPMAEAMRVALSRLVLPGPRV